MNVNPIAMGHNPMGPAQPGMGLGVQGNNPQMGHGMAGYGQNSGKYFVCCKFLGLLLIDFVFF